MINYYLLFILSLIVFLIINKIFCEEFSYFNLNFDLKVPISHNNLYDKYKKINFSLDISNNIIENVLDNTTNLFNNRIKLNNIANFKYTENTSDYVLDSSNCCLIRKEFDSGNFKYNFTPFNGDKCDINLYELDNNNVLLFDGINNWSNKNCTNNNTILGSCRKANFECIDFITEEKCNEINTLALGNRFLKFNERPSNNKLTLKTQWSTKTCQDSRYL